MNLTLKLLKVLKKEEYSKLFYLRIRFATLFRTTRKKQKKFIDVPGDIDENESIFSKSNSQAYPQDINNIMIESLELMKEQNQNINELKQRIQFLENESAKIVPLLEKQNKNIENEKLKSIKRTELIEELSNTPLIQVNKKQDILNKLKDLS